MSSRDWLAGLVGAGRSLSESLNRRRDMRDAQRMRREDRAAAQQDALALLAARQAAGSDGNDRPLTVWAGADLLQYDPKNKEWFKANLRGPVAPGIDLDALHANDAAEHGAGADAAMGALTGASAPMPAPRITVTKPAEVKPPTREPVVPVVKDGRTVYVPQSQAAGQEAPRPVVQPNLITDRSGIRREDRPGLEVPIPGEKPVKTGFDALPPAQQNEVRTQQSAILNMQKAIKALQDAVDDGGLALRPDEYQSKIRSLQADAQVQFKEAARLGALSGPDMGLVEAALGSATNPMQLLRGGKKGVLSSLETAQNSLRNRARTMEQVYGVQMPPEFYGMTPPPAQYSPDNPYAKKPPV